MYTGVCVLEVAPEIIATVYQYNQVSIEFISETDKLYENQYVYLKDIENPGSVGAITRLNNGILHLVSTRHIDRGVSGIKPKNKEQTMALDALMDDDIPVVIMTGKAGSGKTLLALAVALHKKEKGIYDKIILTRPMTQVGTKDSLGFLPGDVDEKYLPFLGNFWDNFEQLFKDVKQFGPEFVMKKYNIVTKPLALIRGASWANSIVIADEVQSLSYHEFHTLGTRPARDTKMILLGDIKQIDGHINVRKTGLYKFVNDERAKNSPMVASIHLLKSERSPVCELFASIFEDQEDI